MLSFVSCVSLFPSSCVLLLLLLLKRTFGPSPLFPTLLSLVDPNLDVPSPVVLTHLQLIGDKRQSLTLTEAKGYRKGVREEREAPGSFSNALILRLTHLDQHETHI